MIRLSWFSFLLCCGALGYLYKSILSVDLKDLEVFTGNGKKSDAERPWQHHQEAVAVNGRTEQVA
jgi:hypothetical protein